MLTYNINGIIYINVHMWCIYYSKDKSFENYVMDEGITQKIIDYIDEQKDGLFIIDLELIEIIKRPFEFFKKYFEKSGKSIVFLNVNNHKTELLHTIGERIIQEDPNNTNQFSTQEINNQYSDLKLDPTIKVERRKQLHIYLFEESIKSKVDTTKRDFLPSSNVFADYYINVKAYFKNPTLFFKVIYELCYEVKDGKMEADYLISSSNTGSVLATGVSCMLNKNARYLQNIGPLLSINDRRLYDRVELGKKYIYIYDFMCLGSEIKRTMLVLGLKNSKIIGASGVSIFQDPFRKYEKLPMDVRYLFNINDMKDYKYSCFFEEN